MSTEGLRTAAVIKWRWEIDWSWSRIYLLPVAYVGKHDVSGIIEDGAGPNWLFQVGWLPLTISLWRYSEFIPDLRAAGGGE